MIKRIMQSFIVAYMLFCGSTYADEVTFVEHLISDNFDNPEFSYPADIDQDGDIDVAVVGRIDGKIAWFDNNGGSPPNFTERNIGASFDNRCVFVTDVDGDGDPDILTTSAISGGREVVWWESDGAVPPNFSKHEIPVNGDDWFPVFATDLDDDGDTDVLVGNGPSGAYANRILWLENNGSSPPSFTERVISTAVNWPYRIFATDLDDDGDIDVLSASMLDDKIAWYENDGGSPPEFFQRVISTNVKNASHVHAADVDGDGDIDVLSGSNQPDYKIVWFESDGNILPIFTEHIITSTANHPLFTFPTDVDDDGDTDVLATHYSADKLVWYDNNGELLPTFTERIIASPVCPPPFTLCFAPRNIYGGYDIDSDGDSDVLALTTINKPADDPGGKLLWYENISITNLPPNALCQDVIVPTEPGLCTAGASVDNGSFDPDGDPITLDQTPPEPYGLGDTEVTLTVTDDNGATDTCDATVTVEDQEPPEISSVTANPNKLWPPNHKMVPVVLAVDATDNCDSVCQIALVESNEPVNGLGDGNTAPDWIITGDLTVKLRAERSGTGSGRIYTITVECTDQSGNSSTDTTTVTVPHDKGKKNQKNKKKK